MCNSVLAAIRRAAVGANSSSNSSSNSTGGVGELVVKGEKKREEEGKNEEHCREEMLREARGLLVRMRQTGPDPDKGTENTVRAIEELLGTKIMIRRGGEGEWGGWGIVGMGST